MAQRARNSPTTAIPPSSSHSSFSRSREAAARRSATCAAFTAWRVARSRTRRVTFAARGRTGAGWARASPARPRRSGERRVGEEGRSRGGPYHLKKKKKEKSNDQERNEK